MVVQLLGFQNFQIFTNKAQHSKRFVFADFLGVIDAIKTSKLKKEM
jgi:hypothetical protein